MDVYEATRIVLSRIQSLDPANASKIMGLLLLQDHEEKEMIRLAFGPQNLIHSVTARAKAELGLMGSTLNPASLPFDLEERLPFLDPRGGGCVSHDLESNLGSGWGQCSYLLRGFCKNGCNCKFAHGGVDETLHGVGSPIMEKCNELLRSKSVPARLAHQFTGGSRLRFSPEGATSQQREAQRAAALLMGDDLHNLGRWRPERIDLSAMACPASRQIYLTFPADSLFREEDVSNYFSTYGPVEDVRIPYQQKRMFGFVSFVYPETVKSILTKGNPHFVCDSRVLVKPYKEKGKVPDKYRSKPSPDGTQAGLDYRDIMDLQLVGRAQDLLWKGRFEERFLELQSTRLMNLQLPDVKKHFQLNQPLDQTPRLANSCLRVNQRVSAKENEKGGGREVSNEERIKLGESLEDRMQDKKSSDESSTVSESIKPFNCQMPSLSMLPGSGGPTCRVGI